jgi:hypothetical protein
VIEANVLRVVGDVLETYGVKPKRGESIADAVARALGLSNRVHCWWKLSEGCSVEEANRRAGIASNREVDRLLASDGCPCDR